MAGTSERAKRLKESRERAKEISKTKDKAPFSPKQTNTKSGVGSKIRKETRPKPTSTKINQALTPSRTSPGSKVRKESRDAKTTTVVKKTTLQADPAKSKPKKLSTRGNPLKDRPRSIAEAKRRGEVYFYDSKGVKKIAATAADLKRTGLTLRQYANKFAPKKQTKKDAESLKPYAVKKRGGGMMKKKGMAAGGRMKKKGMARGGMMMKKKGMAMGGAMKKKGMAAGGKLKMVMKDGKKVPFFAADGKGKMRGGGMMKKKGYAMGGAMKKKGMAKGGAMKKKGYKKGGKVLKMRGGGLATRGTSFTIK